MNRVEYKNKRLTFSLTRQTVRSLMVLMVSLFVMVTTASANYIGPSRNYTVEECNDKCTEYKCTYRGTAQPADGGGSCTVYVLISSGGCPAISVGQWKSWCGWANGPTSTTFLGKTCNATEEVCKDVTKTHPSATISKSVSCGTSGSGGWCVASPSVSFSANEPVSGETIQAVEGDGGGLCSINSSSGSCNWNPSDGVYAFDAWAHSSWGDTTTKTAVSINVDTTNPIVIPSIPGSSGSNGWYTSSVSISVSGSDAISGFASALLQVNGGGYSGSAATITIDGTHSVDFVAYDNAGNSASSSISIQYDATNPAHTPSIPSADGSNGWWVTPVAISVSGSDATSGVGNEEIQVNGGGYGGSSATVSSDGIHTIDFRVTDNAGNSVSSSTSVKFDGTAPSISANIIGTLTNGAYDPDMTLIVNCTDATSGCATEEVRIDGGAWEAPGAFTLSGGSHTIDFRGADNAGNIATSSQSIQVDNTPPAGSVSSQKCYSGTITGTASDNVAVASAVLYIGGSSYNLSMSGDYWSKSVSLSGGNHSAYVFVTDIVGLTYQSENTGFFVDGQKPVVNLTNTWDWNAGGNLSVSDNDEIKAVTIKFTDSEGLNRYQTYHDDTYPGWITWNTFLADYWRPGGSEVYVKVTAEDNCGNKSSASAIMTVPFPPTATPTSMPTSTPTQVPATSAPTMEPTRAEPQDKEVIKPTLIVEVIEEQPTALGSILTFQDWSWVMTGFVGIVVFGINQLADPRPDEWDKLTKSQEEIIAYQSKTNTQGKRGN